MITLDKYIIIVEDVLPAVLTEQILVEYKESNDWIKGTTYNLSDYRNCETIGISFEQVINKNLNVRVNIDEMFFNVASKALKKYNENVPPILSNSYFAQKDTGYELLKYEVGGFYKQHTDSANAGNTPHRILSCSFALNDDYEGGEFAFFDRELVYKLKKGSCIMFPSSFMYPHEIMPVTSGTRYSIITWFV
jgi:predicted 2-oxoglutarate/Fe(II)-dependent dioxygenase YbiX